MLGDLEPPWCTAARRRAVREGCTSVFNIGTSSNTFRHQGASGTGDLVEDGPQLATRYNFPIPTRASISRPFGLAAGSSGGVGDEFEGNLVAERVLA